MGDRALASIQKVAWVKEIPGADAIQQVGVLGWSLVASKDIKEGDWVVFFEIDSILPDEDWVRENFKPKDRRVRTMKFNKFNVISQGFVLDIATVMAGIGNALPFVEGQDVTRNLQVTKYEAPEHNSGVQMGDSAGEFPFHVPKTDEIRIQSAPELLDELYGLPYYVSLKYDGTSATYLYDSRRDEFIVASRNYKKKDGPNVYWDMARKYELEVMCRRFPDLAFQGEIVGPGIQQNRLGLKEKELYIFSIYQTLSREYLSYDLMRNILVEANLVGVRVLDIGNAFTFNLPYLEGLASGLFYPDSGHPAEGIVVRPLKYKYHEKYGQLSFKCINPNYLLKIGE